MAIFLAKGGFFRALLLFLAPLLSPFFKLGFRCDLEVLFWYLGQAARSRTVLAVFRTFAFSPMFLIIIGSVMVLILLSSFEWNLVLFFKLKALEVHFLGGFWRLLLHRSSSSMNSASSLASVHWVLILVPLVNQDTRLRWWDFLGLVFWRVSEYPVSHFLKVLLVEGTLLVFLFVFLCGEHNKDSSDSLTSLWVLTHGDLMGFKGGWFQFLPFACLGVENIGGVSPNELVTDPFREAKGFCFIISEAQFMK